MQRAPYAYVGLAFGHNLDYRINWEQGCSGKKRKQPKWGGTVKGHVNWTPSTKGGYAKSSYLSSNGSINIPEMKLIVLHIKWGPKWWHVPTLPHAQRFKWSSNGSLQLRPVLCKELAKEQADVKHHLIIPTQQAMHNHTNGSRRMQLK